MSWFGSFLNSEAGGNTIGALVGLGVGAVTNNQIKKNAQGQANDAKAIADAQIKAQELALETARLQLQKQSTSGDKKDNTGLYIGLGVGGVLVLGLIVFLVVKK